jgi:hypothetical protein
MGRADQTTKVKGMFGQGQGQGQGEGQGQGQGEGQGQGKSGQGQGQGQGKSGQGQGQGKSGQIGKVQQGSSTSKPKRTEQEVDKRAKEVDEAIKNSEDLSPKSKDVFDKEKANTKIDKSNHQDTDSYTKQEVDYKSIEPKYDWKKLLRRAVSKAENDVEESYAKINRSSITRVKLAVEKGESAVKPGERTRDAFKFALVIDSSGSMTGIINKVYAEFSKLLKSTDLSGETLVYKFSDTFDLYTLNTKTKVAYQINIKTGKKVGGKVNIAQVLYHFSGGTDFSDILRKELCDKVDEGYNILIASDSDIFWSSNLDNLKLLLKKSKRNVFVILDSKNTYTTLIQSTHVVHSNVSYWK